jgi:methyl-accepting chemotaxis protein
MEKDNLEILLEDIRGKFDLVLEGHDVLRKEIRDTRHELCEKIEFVDFKVEALNQKVDAVAVETSAHTDAIRDLTQKVDAVAVETSAHAVAIRDLTQKVDAVAVETSAHTVAIRDLIHKVDSVAVDLSAHRADTEAHHPVYRVKE